MHRVLSRQIRQLGIGEAPPTAEQWARFLDRIDHTYCEADRDRYTLERALDLSSAEMRKRFTELRDAQGRLVQASRKAGMADVATSVLHNVGNVLNSVNVSANVVSQLVKNSARSGLGKSLALLGAQPKPGRFIDEDPRGQKLLVYLAAVDKLLTEERDGMLRETESLAKNIEHIKVVVSQQLAAARGEMGAASVVEQVNVRELLEDAVGVVKGSAGAGSLTFVYDTEPIVISTDRHKCFQIVTNLLANARDAIATREIAGIITLRCRPLCDSQVSIEIEDTGIGIEEDTLARIFSHGFTTKSDGHGFGLHSSACAATELGGSLTVRSDGIGHGATFTLVLKNDQPVKRASDRRSISSHSAESTP